MVKRAAKELKAVTAYNKALRMIEQDMGNRITSDDQLDHAGRILFRSEWAGVSAANYALKLSKQKPYGIYNNHRSPGEHWMPIIWLSKNKRLVYDSFGRKSMAITSDPDILKPKGVKIIDSDRDVEQGIFETNCGQRSLAYLIIASTLGVDYARLI